jgi:hypothetical protein
MGLCGFAYYFDPYSNVFLSITNCLFDSSGLSMVIYLKIYQITKFQTYEFFGVYLIFPLFGLLGCLFLLPDKIKDQKSSTIIVQSSSEEEEDNAINTQLDDILNSEKDEEDKTTLFFFFKVKKSIFTIIFSFGFFHFTVIYITHCLNSLLFLSSATSRISEISKSISDQNTYIEILSWIMPTAFIFGPIIGIFIEKTGFLFSYFAATLLYIILIVFSTIQVLQLQIITFFCFVLFRATFFSWSFGYLFATYVYFKF